jgi:hypothetical protein
LVFTTPVLTGPLSNAEIAAATPFFAVLVPPGYDERLLAETGFAVLQREDVTAERAEVARRFVVARAAHAEALRELEGDAVFARQNEYRAMAEQLAREQRLAGIAFLARKVA